MIDILQPLQPNETYVRLHFDGDHLLGVLNEAGIRAYALAETIRQAEAHGLEITRGPEFVTFHSPEYPGDQTWADVIAIARVAPLV